MVDSDQAEIPGKIIDYLGIERRIRAVVDNDHFVVIRFDMALVSG